jgi:hypothetical protein
MNIKARLKRFWSEDLPEYDKYNVVDSLIQKQENPEVEKIYQSRWVWYHTILALEIFLTNILLIAILVKL